jgi:hypothetical protein
MQLHTDSNVEYPETVYRLDVHWLPADDTKCTTMKLTIIIMIMIHFFF